MPSSTNHSSTTTQGYALFDLDQTLIPWDTQLLFCNYVLQKHPLRRLYLLTYLPLLPFASFIGTQGMKRAFLNYLWRLSPKEIETMATSFVDSIFPHVFYPEMLEELKKQQESGRTVILSSASPEIWVKHIAKKLGISHYFGTEVETSPKVKLFPRIIGGNNKGANKLIKMKQLLPNGFDPSGKQKLPNSHGFSDSHADLPMLNICHHVSIVNPTPKLQSASQHQDWTTHTPPRPTSGKWGFIRACIRQALGIYQTPNNKQ